MFGVDFKLSNFGHFLGFLALSLLVSLDVVLATVASVRLGNRG